MNGQRFDAWADRVRSMARALPYPPTPDIAGKVQGRLARPGGRFPALPRLAWVMAALLLAALLAAPQVRAEAWRWVQVGAIRIHLMEARPSPQSAAPPRALADLVGETTLAAARAGASFPVRLPTYPADLGPPDRVYLQELEGAAVILVWLAPGQPQQVRMTLHQLEADFWATKTAPLVEETTVEGGDALWVNGPHLLEVRSGESGSGWAERRLVEGNVLVWVEGGVTYRLETMLALEEAIRVAESLE